LQRLQLVSAMQHQTGHRHPIQPNTRRRACLSIRFQCLPIFPSFPSLKTPHFHNSGARKPALECAFPEFPEFPE